MGLLKGKTVKRESLGKGQPDNRRFEEYHQNQGEKDGGTEPRAQLQEAENGETRKVREQEGKGTRTKRMRR